MVQGGEDIGGRSGDMGIKCSAVGVVEDGVIEVAAEKKIEGLQGYYT